MRPSGRMFCFTAPPRAPAGACSAPPPARPGAPDTCDTLTRETHAAAGAHGGTAKRALPAHPEPIRHSPGTRQVRHTQLPSSAHTARSRPNPPRTPHVRAPAFARAEHVTHLPIRQRPTSSPPRRRAGFPRASARLPSFTMLPGLAVKVETRCTGSPPPIPCRHGALQTPHGPHRPRRSSPSLRNAACTPTSVHRSTARKSPVLPAGRTGREASEASTAARSAADSLKWLSP